jgi:hypothetical protein
MPPSPAGVPPGAGEPNLDGSATIEFYNFASLALEKGFLVRSRTFTCLGFDWSLRIYPGGDSKSDDGMIACYLFNESHAKIVSTKFEIVLKKQVANASTSSETENEHHQSLSVTKTFAPGKGYGRSNFVDRSQVINDRTLTFVIRIRPDRSNYHQHDLTSKLIPKFKLFGDKKSSDLSFVVRKRVFNAHLVILLADAPGLAQIADFSAKKKRISIYNVDPTLR